MKDNPLNEDLLADALVDVVDDIRREVHGELGTRPWAVDVVTRTWSGSDRGVGTPTVSIMTLDPTPMVRRNAKNRLGPAGQEPQGSVTLTGVSLRYTQEELRPRVDKRTEVRYRIRDLHGTRQKPRFFVLSADPIARRGDKSGDGTDWYLVLEESAPMSGLDGVDSP